MSSLRIRIRFIQACGILWMLCAAAAMPARQVEAATTTAAATTGPDVCGYPDNSNLPRTGAIFNESGVLRAFSPVSRATTAVGQGLTIKMWYNDEHALTLGVRRVVVKSSSGTTTTNYPFTATPSSPTSAVSPLVGATAASGDQTGNDVAVGGGRPMWPVLFITDLTLNGASSRAGDWQQGGIGVAPQRVSGIWKGAVRTVDKTVSPAKVTITPDADPAKNGWAGIPDAPAGGFASIKNEGYGAECVWKVDDLGLLPGHVYRFQFMVHDGDQNNAGGDVGEACTIVTVETALRVQVNPARTDSCEGTPVQLCAEIDPTYNGVPPYTYLWSNGSTDRCITVSAPSAGASAVYSVKASDSAGHQSTASGSVYGHRCGIALAMQADPAEVCAGRDVQVTYQYRVTNNGDFFTAAGTLVDDNGTTGNPADDFTVGSWGPLAPGATQSLSATRTINLITSLTHRAIASGTSGQAAVSAQASATVTPHRCEIALEKQAAPTQVPLATDAPVAYSYKVTNAGDYFAASGTLVDDNGTPGNPADDFTVGSWGPLAPGGSQPLSASRTLNISTPLTNTAVASGTSGGSAVSAQATATVSPRQPRIALELEGSLADICAGSDVEVTYGYKVTNTGYNSTASGTLVDDNGTPADAADDFTVGSWGPLAPGASQTLSASRTINISAPLVHTAVASGTSGGTPVTAEASATVTPHHCVIALIEKDNPVDVCVQSNAEVTCNYTVTNAGDFFAASGTLTDDHGTPGDPADDVAVGNWGPLAPGQSQTLSSTETMSLAKPMTNTAVASGTSGTEPVSATATGTVATHRCEIALEKSGSLADVCAGKDAAVTYEYKVTNTGDFFEASGTVVDDNGTPGDAADDFTVGSWGPLAPGASQSLSANRTLNIRVPLTNTAVASGICGESAVGARATATVTPHVCEIALEKSAGPADVCAGSDAQVVYGYQVTNTGDFFEASGTLVDDNGTPGDAADDFAVGSWGPLVPGASQSLSAVRTLNLRAPLTNRAVASGTTGTVPVSAQASATVTPHRCELALEKSAGPEDVCAGNDAQVTYGYKVTNSGDFFEASGSLVDDNGTPGDAADDFAVGSWGPLEPGASQSLSAVRTLNLRAPLTNRAVASGTTGTMPVSAQASATVTPHHCEIALEKHSNLADVCAGSDVAVTYDYQVTNTGDFFAASGTLVDDNGTPGSPADDFAVGSWGPLAPGASQSLSAVRTLNIRAPLTNTAVASGTSGTAAVRKSASATVTPHRCEIALVKSADPTDIHADADAQVTYGYTVTNSGDFFAALGTMVDDNGTPANPADDFAVGSWGPLAPGASQSLSANRTIHISAPLTNTAVASGTSGTMPVTAKATATVRPHRSSISLTKTPDVCEVQAGLATPVNFKYVVTNTGDFYAASGTLVDDNGTPGFAGDDVKIGDWGPLAAGAGAELTHTFTLTGAHTNIAVASGTSAGSSVTAQATATVGSFTCACNLSYPDNSNLPRSGVLFNESEVLRAFDPGPANCGGWGSKIKLWYNDEHALTLGVRRVIVKTSTGTTTTNYPVTATPASPTAVNYPQIGTSIASGDQTGNDVAAGGGRPLWPALFITDLTVNGASSRAGDWQQGGAGIPPNMVCGTWKAAVRTVDKTVIPAKVTVTPDADPAKNNWAGIVDTPPGGFAALTNQGYGAECTWNVNELGLIPGHTYRMLFMVHDGDQNNAGGDAGEACTTVHITAPGPCGSATVTASTVAPSSAMQASGNDEATAGQVEAAEQPAAQGPAIADALELYRPTPNPFRESTRFAFAVSGPEAQPVSVGVYDVTGRQVRSLAGGQMVPGRYESRWDGRNEDGSNVSGGVYFVRVLVGGRQVAFRVLYLR